MQNTSHTRTARDLPETLQNFHNYNKALGQAMLVVWEGGARKEGRKGGERTERGNRSCVQGIPSPSWAHSYLTFSLASAQLKYCKFNTCLLTDTLSSDTIHNGPENVGSHAVQHRAGWGFREIIPLVLKGVGALLGGKLGNLRCFSLSPVTGGGVDSHSGKQGFTALYGKPSQGGIVLPSIHPSLTSECPIGHTCRWKACL